MKSIRAVAIAGVLSSLASALLVARSPIAASLRAGKPLSGVVLGTDLVDYARHSDTLMVWRYSPREGRVDVLSIPRDTKIDLPGYRFRRINEVFAYHYGVKRNSREAALEVIEAVNHLLTKGRVPLDLAYFFHVDYNGFRRFIDLLGGVNIHIEEPMHYDDNAGGLHIHWEPGDYHFNGQQSLEYVRFRGKSGDRGRILRQMEFLKAVSEKLSSPLLFIRWPRLAGTVLGSLHTNITPWDLFLLALEAKHVGPDKVNPWLLPGHPKGAFWELDEERTALVLQQIMTRGAADKPAFETDTRSLPASSPAAARPITVKVWNGSRQEGLALTVARRLRAARFDVLEWGNYGARQRKTRVMDRAGTIEKAKKVAQSLGMDSVFSDVDPGVRVDVEVILGEDYLDPPAAGGPPSQEK
jgi:LCP family protein required for cell wall assembly